MGLINFMANSILIIFFARVCMCVCVYSSLGKNFRRRRHRHHYNRIETD